MSQIYFAGTAKSILPNGDFIGVAPELKEALHSLNHQSVDLEKSDTFIALNHSKSAFKAVLRQKRIKKKILIRIEPDAVHPIQFTPRIEREYDLIVTPGGIPGLQKSRNFFTTPYRPSANQLYPRLNDLNLREFISEHKLSRTLDFDHWLSRKNEVAFIASNKVSPGSESNYKLRQEIVRNNLDGWLDVFGGGWDDSFVRKIYSSVRTIRYSLMSGAIPDIASVLTGVFDQFPKTLGHVPDKHLTLIHYKYNLVVENSNSFFTEKLLDALVNGCVPIYFGPKLDAFGIPDDVYLRFDGTLECAKKLIDSLNEKELYNLKAAAKEFITHPEFTEHFSAQTVYTRIANEIHNLLVS
jgi:hypothetical protein